MSFELISMGLNLLLGGGFLVTLATLRSQKVRAKAEAKGASASAESQELDNVEKAIRIWREMAESLKAELQDLLDKHEQVTRQVQELKRAVDRLNTTNTKILKLLDKIQPDNYEKMVAAIKEEIDKAHA